MWKILGKGKFTIVEMGAGKGWLCYDIISFIKDRFPKFLEKIDYKIVEISKWNIMLFNKNDNPAFAGIPIVSAGILLTELQAL